MGEMYLKFCCQKKNKIYKEYQKNQLDIVETSEALKKYQNQQQTMRLYAPIAGFVQEISINTIVCKFYFSFD
jgi:iron-sulfur cluster repair protein YtfE (RIC family)